MEVRMAKGLPRVLLVDDEAANLRTFVRSFRNELDVRTAGSAPEAVACLEKEQFDVLITDQAMPGEDGVSLLLRVRDRWPKLPRLMMTGYPDLDAVRMAAKDGLVSRVILKPFSKETVLREVETAVRLQAMRERVSALREAGSKDQ
jgi:DNA-binding NtrC family response regulator